MEYTLEKFCEGLKAIEVEASQKRELLNKVFAIHNNPYKVGDIVEDSNGKLEIEKITYSSSYGNYLPQCVFRGIDLKKDGTPKLRQDKDRRVYQSNIIKE